ncbi:uracil-DNA glycosylase [bacterium]|nr:uracil-DNA glycosylase [bacterium]MDB4508407.1 uracil-DNA glycosylase [Akkermansiaceae bacterium]
MAKPSVIEYLKQLQEQGQTHVEIDDEARIILREFYRRGSAQGQKRPTQASSPAQTTAPAIQSAPAAQSAPTPAVSQIQVTGTTPAEKIASLAAQCLNWQPSKALGTLRDRMVFSTGNPEADFMLIGEAPGYQEEKEQQPFVGPAGQKLDQIIKAMGLSRPEVYISTVCKFRPSMKNQTTGNRKPSPEEMATNLPFLRAEIDIVKPKVIIALGGTAAEGLLEEKKAVGQLRENWHQFQGIPLRVTFHPSYLLRQNEGLNEKRMVWEDMLAVMEKLGLPINEKQREYFLPKS